MNETLAIELAYCKARELGTKDYILRFRHFVLKQSEPKAIKNSDDIFFIIGGDETFEATSNAGSFNLTDNTIGEQQYVHTGDIAFKNLIPDSACQIKLLQLILL